MSGQTWAFTFPAPAKMQTTNTAKHWGAASSARSTFRSVTYLHAIRAKLPRGLDRVRVDIELRFPRAAVRDATNYHPLVAKPCLDSLSRARRYQITRGSRAGTWVVEPGYGLIPDDNPKAHLHCEDCPHLRISAALGPKPFGEIAITITDLSDLAEETPSAD